MTYKWQVYYQVNFSTIWKCRPQNEVNLYPYMCCNHSLFSFYWPGPPSSLPHHGRQPCQPQLLGRNGAQAGVSATAGHPVQILASSSPHAGRGRLHKVGSRPLPLQKDPPPLYSKWVTVYLPWSFVAHIQLKMPIFVILLLYWWLIQGWL